MGGFLINIFVFSAISLRLRELCVDLFCFSCLLRLFFFRWMKCLIRVSSVFNLWLYFLCVSVPLCESFLVAAGGCAKLICVHLRFPFNAFFAMQELSSGSRLME